MKNTGVDPIYRIRPPNPLERIAFWQFLGFVLLLAVVWVDQVLDLSEALFGVPSAKNSWLGAAIVSVAIIVIGFVTVAHTFVQQRRMLHGFLRVCTYCKRIKVDNQLWEQMEKFISERSRAEFSHGICPDCFKRVVADLDATSNPAPVAGTSAPPPPESSHHV